MMEFGELMAVIAIIFSTTILFYWRGSRDRRLLAQIPGPPGWPIIGSLITFMRPREELIPVALKLLEMYGPIMYVNALGVTRVIVASPEAIQVVLHSKDNLTKDSSYNFIKPWLRTGLLTSTGEKWRSRRRMLEPAFHYKILQNFVHVFNVNSSILVDRLRKHTEKEYVEINDYITHCALDNICETVMGTSVNAQKGEGLNYAHAVKRMCFLFVDRHFSLWLHLDCIYYRTWRGREQKKVVETLQEFSGKVIKRKISEYEEKKTNLEHNNNDSKKRLSFLDMLLEMSDQEGKLTDEDIREEVDTFMFAGHDTTASGISWTLFLLGAHQDIQDKVASELSDIFGDDPRQLTMADLNNMVYLEKVIKEVLRIYPSVPIVSRILETDVSVGDYTIPAGINVMISPFLLHRNPEVYPDPEKFDPERFSPEQTAGRHPCAYIPFSAGPRNCIGQKFARLEMMPVVSSVLRAFKLESLDKENKMVLSPDIVMKPKYPFKIKISPRV